MCPVTRRDFLRFRTGRGQSTAEILCERLHMHYTALQATTGEGGNTQSFLDDPSSGEPSPVYAVRTVEQMIDALEHDIEGADVLRIVDASWLKPDVLRCRLEALVGRFSARGGKVEFVTAAGHRTDSQPD